MILIYYGPAHSYDEVTIFKVNNGYLWLTIVENISITVSFFIIHYYFSLNLIVINYLSLIRKDIVILSCVILHGCQRRVNSF